MGRAVVREAGSLQDGYKAKDILLNIPQTQSRAFFIDTLEYQLKGKPRPY